VGLDRVKLIVTGSAPIAGHVLDFLRIVFCCPVLEGYGMTETAAAATLTWANDCESGTVGPPTPVNDMRLQDVPDMGYLSTDTSHGEGDAKMACCGRGEICFRGPNIFKGYYKMPDKTAESIDKDDWLHSGDIGLWTTDGRLKIIDRKKNIFKLQQGEYVAPEKIENILAQSKFIAQNMVYGDSLQRDLVLIATVDPDEAAAWAAKNKITGDVGSIAANPKFKAEVMADIKVIGSKAKLVGFEFPKDVHLDAVPWEPGGFALTPTFKL
jgi:long-chain acyl-CoA synthetase